MVTNERVVIPTQSEAKGRNLLCEWRWQKSRFLAPKSGARNDNSFAASGG